jgi:hypothetical protein
MARRFDFHMRARPSFQPTKDRRVRAFVKDGDIAAAVKGVKEGTRIYPLSAAANPPQTVFVNTSSKQLNTISANDFHFYEELNAVIQAEPADAFDPETVGLFASIGIKKGRPFAPDTRMKGILTEAIAVGLRPRAPFCSRPETKGRNITPIASGPPSSWAAATFSWTRAK